MPNLRKPIQLSLFSQEKVVKRNPAKAARRRARREAASIAANPDAPWGRKKDGTPKKKPGHRHGAPFKPKKPPPRWRQDRTFRSEHPYQSKAWWKDYRTYHKERESARVKNWIKQNPERRRATTKKWNASHKDQKCAASNKRRATKISATPPWANHKAIKAMYRLAKAMSDHSAIKYTVDHIVPLKHPLVCGLHVEANMQILSHSDNSRKGNRFIEAIAVAPTTANGLLVELLPSGLTSVSR